MADDHPCITSLAKASQVVLSLIFLAIAVANLVNPQSSFASDGIDFASVPPAGRAELRAYYVGTAFVIAWFTFTSPLRTAVTAQAIVLGGFASTRVVAYALEGQDTDPGLRFSQHAVFASECMGAASMLFLRSALPPAKKAPPQRLREKKHSSVTALIETLAFPGVLLASLLLAAALQPLLGDDAAMVVTGLASALLIFVLEGVHPYEVRWTVAQGKHEVHTDVAHIFLMTVTDNAVRGFVTVWASRSLLLGRVALTPSAWDGVPLWVQVCAAAVVAELGGWALHAALHVRSSPLWQLHRVHHAVQRLYVFNTYRFHPIDLALQLLCSHPLLHLAGLGASAPVLFWFTVLINTVGQLSHCNVATRCGALSYIFNTPCAHRVHHSRIVAEANSNYGQVLLVFDVLFGTHRMPVPPSPGGGGALAASQPRIGDKFLSNAGVWANLSVPISEMYRQSVRFMRALVHR